MVLKVNSCLWCMHKNNTDSMKSQSNGIHDTQNKKNGKKDSKVCRFKKNIGR